MTLLPPETSSANIAAAFRNLIPRQWSLFGSVDADSASFGLVTFWTIIVRVSGA